MSMVGWSCCRAGKMIIDRVITFEARPLYSSQHDKNRRELVQAVARIAAAAFAAGGSPMTWRCWRARQYGRAECVARRPHCGQRRLGENFIHAGGSGKIAALSGLGLRNGISSARSRANKTRPLAEHFDCTGIAPGSLRGFGAAPRVAGPPERCPQVNVSGEGKSGVRPTSGSAEAVVALPQLARLMYPRAYGRRGVLPEAAFATGRDATDQGIAGGYLSMGMSPRRRGGCRGDDGTGQHRHLR